MKIKSLILTKNVRMALRYISYVSYTPTLPIQLILGSNGSGKSTLMWELSPLPADPSEYEKDGSKVIEIEHRNEHYRLTSWFSPSTKHSFLRLRDNEELNPGNTLSVQKDLCSKIFDYDQDLHLVMTGNERFSTMAPKVRREWIMRLSPTSYDYALKQYRRVQEALRDATGSLRRSKDLLVSKEAQVVSIDEQSKLTKEIESMHQDLQVMLEIRKPVENDSNQLMIQSDKAKLILLQLSNQLLSLRAEHPYSLYGEPDGVLPIRNDWGELVKPKFSNTNQVLEYIQGLKGVIIKVQTQIDQETKVFDRLKNTLDVLMKSGQKTRQSMEAEVDQCKKTIEEHRKSYRLGQITINLEAETHVTRIVESMYDSLYEVLMDFPENPENEEGVRKYGKYRREMLMESFTKTQTEFNELLHKEAKLKGELSHVQHHQAHSKLTCPSCQHSWTPGNPEAVISEINRQLDVMFKKSQELAAKNATTGEEIIEIDKYLTKFRQYLDITKSMPSLNELWLEISTQKVLLNTPKKVMAMWFQLKEDILHLREVQRLQEQINELEKMIAAAIGIGDANLQSTQKEMDEVEAVIQTHTQSITQYKTWLTRYETYRRNLVEAESLSAQIQHAQQESDSILTETVETLRREMLNHAIRQFTISLNAKEANLASITAKRIEVDSLIKQIEHHEACVTTYKAIRDTLSPTDGLIAKGMLGFVQSLIEEMNETISHIWSYPMTLMDCTTMVDDTAELDYVFPVQVNHHDRPVPHVGKLSEGQKEVVDMAWKLVVMKYRSIEKDILRLDEFGSKMDTAHKHAASMAINRIIQDYGFNQVFMVSHDTHLHGALHADVNVLDPTNIVIPEVYNQHLELQ